MHDSVDSRLPETVDGRAVTALLGAALTVVSFYAAAFLTSTGAYEGIPSRFVLGVLALGVGVAALARTVQAVRQDAGLNTLGNSERTESETPVETLRRRYAEGEMGDGEFERRLETLLTTENVDNEAENRQSKAREMALE